MEYLLFLFLDINVLQPGIFHDDVYYYSIYIITITLNFILFFGTFITKQILIFFQIFLIIRSSKTHAYLKVELLVKFIYSHRLVTAYRFIPHLNNPYS